MEFARQRVIPLRLQEIRQDIGESPTCTAEVPEPSIVIFRTAPCEYLAVHGTAAPENATLDKWHLAAVQIGLTHGAVVPGQAAFKELEKPGRAVDVGIGIARTGLDQKDRNVFSRAEAVRDDAPRCAGSNNDIVELPHAQASNFSRLASWGYKCNKVRDTISFRGSSTAKKVTGRGDYMLAVPAGDVRFFLDSPGRRVPVRIGACP